MAGMEDAGPEMALRKLTQTFGVTGYVILNKNGIPVQHYGMTETQSVQFAGIFSELTIAAQNFLTKRLSMDPQGTDEDSDLVCLRLRTFKNEYVVCPEKDYTLVVVHNPNWVKPVETDTGGAGDGEDGDEKPEGAAAAGTRPGTRGS